MAATHDLKTRDAVVASYGIRTASDAASTFGLSRNTVISMWRRARVDGRLGAALPRTQHGARLRAERDQLQAALSAMTADRDAHRGRADRAERERDEGLRKAVEDAFQAAASAALQARFGPPSMWGGDAPGEWNRDEPCSPRDASMHDNGCVDAFREIRVAQMRALNALAANTKGRDDGR